MELDILKLSRYNFEIPLDEECYILYNTLWRTYGVYKKCSKQRLQILLEDLNRGSYDLQEVNCLKKLIRKKMIIEDDVNELDILAFEENKARFSDSYFNLKILTTLDCNFRCVYCYEEHKKLDMDDKTAESIIKFVKRVLPKVKGLRVAWFGGEPLIGFNRITALTQQFKALCEENGCKYSAHITSNGYLINDEISKKLRELNVEKIQITLDGSETYHNQKRPLQNGQGTFCKIKENILRLLDEDVFLTLRINVDQENYNFIEPLFDMIPKEKRQQMEIMISNLFQNKEKINLYSLYRASVEKGYRYSYTNNNYTVCQVCYKNGLAVMPDGQVILCTHADEKEYRLGYIDDEGDFILKNEGLYYKIKNVSALNNEKCVKCIQLPMCIGSCKFSRYKDNTECRGKGGDGLSLESRIKLHYYSDLAENKLTEEELFEFLSFF